MFDSNAAVIFIKPLRSLLNYKT